MSRRLVQNDGAQGLETDSYLTVLHTDLVRAITEIYLAFLTANFKGLVTMKTMLLAINHGVVLTILLLTVLVATSTASAQSAVSAEKLKLPAGFVAELIYSVPAEQGSWVSLTSEKNGRLIASDQYGNLYRISPSTGQAPKIERIDLQIGFAQGLLYAFDSLYVVAHPNDKTKMPAGLYRVRDTDGDDRYDAVQLLRKINGSGEHGPHAVILSPDKKSLYICAGNHTKSPNPETLRMSPRWGEDQLLTRYDDANGHAAGIMAPGGWICKTDPEGKAFEMISTGYRNEYDIAFDPNGELFTYDADMEWDVGLPWYRPTRVCHVTSGSEFGWRHGSGKWPESYPDSLPSVVDVGPGSPTGIVFGTGAKFPAAYQHALFIADWSYGIIYAVHLAADGASYTGTLERFCSAPALPVTDMTVNPADGAFYFLIGGRRSQSGLYRVTYQGAESTAPAKYPALTPEVVVRRQLEESHLSSAHPNLNQVWPNLRSADRFIRFAARVALEKQPPADWVQRVVNETDANAIIESVIALARSSADNSQQALAITKLAQLDWSQLTELQRLGVCRAFGLTLIRLGTPTQATVQAVQQLKAHFPTGSEKVDRELAKLLIASKLPSVTSQIVDLMVTTGTQEQQMAYATMLADATLGWTIPVREKYFQWFLDAAKIQGGHSLSGYVGNVRAAAIQKMSATDQAALKTLLAKEPETRDPYADLKARPLVKNWTMTDLQDLVSADFAGRNLENGKKMFAVAACYKCHRISGNGGIVGPDVTLAGYRFNTHDLLETIVDPSKSISDQYEATIFLLLDGRVVTGRVANLNGDLYQIQADMILPGNFTPIKVSDIEEMKPSKVSLMPNGLLDNLTKDEIADLLAYLKSTAPSAVTGQPVTGQN